MKKRGQAWGFDLMIAFVIFITGIVIFFFFSINYPTEGQDTLNLLFYEGNLISDSILSDGYPENWDSGTVSKIGIQSAGTVNQTKLENFYNLAQADYSLTQALFNTRYEYFMNFSEEILIDSNPIEGIGNSFQSQNPKNLVKITRFTIYENKPTTLNLYIWEDE